MSSTIARLIGNAVLALALLGMTSCGGPEAADAADEPVDDKPARRQASSSTKTQPDGWVRTRCGICSCRVFSGKDPNCKRPTCKHHWSDHK